MDIMITVSLFVSNVMTNVLLVTQEPLKTVVVMVVVLVLESKSILQLVTAQKNTT